MGSNLKQKTPFQINEDSFDRSKGNRFFYSRLQMFRTYKTVLRLYALPFFVLFGLLDIIYVPHKGVQWLGLRISVMLCGWLYFEWIKRRSWARQRIRWFILLIWTHASVVMSFMVYETGGAHSAYIPGILVTSVCLLLLFHLPRMWAIASQTLFTLPIAIGIYLATASSDLISAITAVLCFSAIIVVTAFGSYTNDQLDAIWRKAQKKATRELEIARRGEFLKNHFPPNLRRQVENGSFEIGVNRIVPSSVVGFADLIGSTFIGNSVDIHTDWDLKEKFLSAATSRGTEYGMVVLNQLGDGFFFIANYGGIEGWEENLMNFFDAVTNDLEQILKDLKLEIEGLESGVRFGVAKGEIMTGWIGQGGQSYFTAVGPEVNLAARLCAEAGRNEMVITSNSSLLLEKVVKDRVLQRVNYSNLKGFKKEIPCFHIGRKSLTRSKAA